MPILVWGSGDLLVNSVWTAFLPRTACIVVIRRGALVHLVKQASKHGRETISQLGCVKVSQMLTELFPSWKNVSVFLRFFFF